MGSNPTFSSMESKMIRLTKENFIEDLESIPDARDINFGRLTQTFDLIQSSMNDFRINLLPLFLNHYSCYFTVDESNLQFYIKQFESCGVEILSNDALWLSTSDRTWFIFKDENTAMTARLMLGI